MEHCSYCKKLSDDIIEIPNGYTTVRVCKDCEKSEKKKVIKEVIICFIIVAVVVSLFNLL